MLYQSQEEKPVVLVFSEPGLMISNLTLEFLTQNDLASRLIYLDEYFFTNGYLESLSEQKIYKIIFIFGFNLNKGDFYQKTFNLFNSLSQKQGEKIPLILISTTNTKLSILDSFDLNYQRELDQQQTFLKDFYAQFSGSLIFLAQDLLTSQSSFTYPLLLFFSAFKKGYFCDPQAKFYFQDEVSFFNLIKQYLIRPHLEANFIIRGSVVHSTKLVEKISYLYEQYFQKKLSIIKLFSDSKKTELFQEFNLVNNTKSNIENLLDERIRLLSSSDNLFSAPELSQLNLEKALQASEFRNNLKKRQLEEQKLQKQQQEAELNKAIDLVKQTHKEVVEAPTDNVFDSDFENKIEKLFSTQRKTEKKVRQEKNIVQGKTIIKKSKKRKILFWLGSFLFVVGFVFLGLFSLFNLSKQNLQDQLFQSVATGGHNIQNIDKSIIYKVFDFQLKQYEKIFLVESLTDAFDIRNLNNSLLNLTKSQVEVVGASYQLYKKTFEGGVELKQFYEDWMISINKQMEAQKAFNSYLMSLNLELYQGTEKEVWQKAQEESKKQIKNSLQKVRFFEPFSRLMLNNDRVNLLFLIQDSAELRATGGFLTEVILLSFDNGVLVDKQVLDVNELEKMVYGNKEANEEIRDLLGETSLHLRDSNWLADFSKSSQEISWFIEQTTGSKVDLSFAINSKTISKILEVVDGVQLDDHDFISSLNFLERQEKTAFLDYKNLGNQKFTWQLSNSLASKLMNLDEQKISLIGEVLITQLNQREILIHSNDQELQKAIEANSWAGQKIAVVCPAEFKQENCLLDSIFQVENNVGVNKINPYIQETIEHNVGISKEFIRHKRKILMENLAKSEVWPLGTYRSYLKFYLNKDAALEKIELNGQKINVSQIKNIDGEQSREVSFLVEVKKQQKAQLEITYLIPNNMKTPFSYVFFDQKQAGVFAKETTYNIVFDEEFKPQLIAPQAVYQDRVVRFANSNEDHFLFAINFSE